MIKHIARLTLPLVLAGCSLTPVASQVPGYLTTPKGALLQDGDGRCWRTAEWRPALAIPECDPEVVRAREQALAAEQEEEDEQEEEAKNEAVAGDAAAEEQSPAEQVVAEPGTADGPPVAGAAPEGARQQAAAAAAAALATSLGVTPARAPRFRDEVVFEPAVLNSDASFFFGDDQLTDEGRAAVREIAGLLLARRATDLSISVVGHTDRIGSAAANLALSRRRAAAVKTALIAAGLPGTAIEVVGMGANKPVAGRDRCPDRLVRCELIACLRPDRRVEIQARGRLPAGTRRVQEVEPAP